VTDPAARLRRCFLGLAAGGVVGTAVELALSRHWNSAVQLIPWATLAVMVVGLVLLVARPGRRSMRTVRMLAAAVLLAAAFGVFEHASANYDAGPLDFRYTSKWATMSAASRWWAAASQSVGPSPMLAPLVLAQSALCLVFATLGHPALAAGTTGTAAEEDRTR